MVPVILAAIVAALAEPSLVGLVTQVAVMVDGENCVKTASTEWLSSPMAAYGLPETETRLTDQSAAPITWAVYVHSRCP
jgi:hypothetical protein